MTHHLLKSIFGVLLFMAFSLTGMSQTVTWTGNTDTDWHKACNWDLNVIPTCSHDVVVPNVVNDPIVAGVAHCNTIDVQTSGGALLTIMSSGSGLLEVATCPTAATNNGGCNLLPNGSFEDMSCCPTTLAEMPCVDSWVNGSTGGSADYFNTCGITSAGGIYGPPPAPIPDGVGYTGFLDIYKIFPSIEIRKEYIGLCLSSALTPAQAYTFEFDIANSNGAFGITMAIYGTTSCTNLPYAATTCPTDPPTTGWVLLGTVGMTPDNIAWQTGTIAFTAPSAIIGLLVGSNCTNASTVQSQRYFYLDNLKLF